MFGAFAVENGEGENGDTAGGEGPTDKVVDGGACDVKVFGLASIGVMANAVGSLEPLAFLFLADGPTGPGDGGLDKFRGVGTAEVPAEAPTGFTDGTKVLALRLRACMSEVDCDCLNGWPGCMAFISFPLVDDDVDVAAAVVGPPVAALSAAPVLLAFDWGVLWSSVIMMEGDNSCVTNRPK